MKKIIIFLLSLVFIFSIVYIAYNVVTNIAGNKTYNEIKNAVNGNTVSMEDKKIIDKVNELHKSNEEVVGYIKMDDTNISYPILQGQDNDFYLTHDYNKKQNVNGSIFLSYKGDLSNTDINSIIYGHNMKSGSMFHDLNKFEDEEFYKKHTKFKIYTLSEVSEYEIVCVFKSRVFYKDETDVFKYYDYIDLDEKKYAEYIKNIKKLELYDTKVDANYGEQLITLSTCEYSQNNGRMVLTAKKI